jgi:hypothetical protein
VTTLTIEHPFLSLPVAASTEFIYTSMLRSAALWALVAVGLAGSACASIAPPSLAPGRSPLLHLRGGNKSPKKVPTRPSRNETACMRDKRQTSLPPAAPSPALASPASAFLWRVCMCARACARVRGGPRKNVHSLRESDASSGRNLHARTPRGRWVF